MTRPELVHFGPSEFGGHWALMNDRLLWMLDGLREAWSAPIHISPVAGATARFDATGSQHNVNRWGESRAVDIFPEGINNEPQMREAFVRLAADIGFTGIGVYPNQTFNGRRATMIHLDVRADREVGQPAQWARLESEGREFVDIGQGIFA